MYVYTSNEQINVENYVSQPRHPVNKVSKKSHAKSMHQNLCNIQSKREQPKIKSSTYNVKIPSNSKQNSQDSGTIQLYLRKPEKKPQSPENTKILLNDSINEFEILYSEEDSFQILEPDLDNKLTDNDHEVFQILE
jgi:hypothetical protein